MNTEAQACLSPEELASLGYLLARRKKTGNYYTHYTKRGGSGAAGYSIGLLSTGKVNLISWEGYIRRGLIIKGFAELKNALAEARFPLGPSAPLSAALPALPPPPTELATFRLQVAEQLRRLLTAEDIMPMLPPADRTKCFLRNTQVRNAAKALHIEL